MDSITYSSINHYILRKQHLTQDSNTDGTTQIIKDLCGLQSTGTFEPYVYLFSRKTNFKKEELDSLLYESRDLIKIRGMRNTLFIVPIEDAPIIHNATNYLKESRFDGFFTHTDFTRDEYFNLESQILQVLKKESLITTDIKKKIPTDRNISIIISLMCDKLLLVRDQPPKGWKDRRNKYALMKNYYPDLNFEGIEEQEAINSLVYKYVDAYGPVTEEDIAWWGSFTKTSTRKALEFNKNKIEKLTISDSEYYILKSDIKLLEKTTPPKPPKINFIANLDPYLMGYKKRERFIKSDIYDFVFDRSGNGTTTILFNGEVIGIWDFQDKPEPLIKFLLFEKPKENVINEIKKKASQIGQFILEQEVKIQECSNSTPLTKRSAGTFMRPLKEC